MHHTDWFNATTNNDSGLQAAKRAGITVATLNRQLKKGELSAEYVIAISRAYNHSPVVALVETEYLQPSETQMDIETVIRSVSDQVLIRDLARRINDNPAHWEGTFSAVVDTPVDELAARRSNNRGIDVESEPYAADNSDTEPEMGDEGYHEGP